jgi:beta-lactamase superfamily II metal-dependent hydrolase
MISSIKSISSESLPLRSQFLLTIEKLRESISIRLTPFDSLGILRSLILHEGASKDPLPFLRILGFVHLITASGIHLSAILSFWSHILQAICQYWQISARIGLRVGRTIGFLLCFFLWILNGARLGMLRPALVILFQRGATLLGFRWRKGSPLLFALVLEWIFARYQFYRTGIEPPSGRWIYAFAVGGGLLGYHLFKSWKHTGLAIGSWVFVALGEAWSEGWVALGTPFLSLITLPFFCTFLYPSVLVGLLLEELGFRELGKWILSILNELSVLLLQVLTHLALHSGNLWVLSRTSLALGAIAAGTALVILVTFKRRLFSIGIWLGLVLAFRLADTFKPHSEKRSLVASQVEQLDVGQGDAALVHSSNHFGLIDAGSERSLSESAWFSLFAERQILQLDWVALTHLDEDHSGGLLKLAKLIPIRCVSASEGELQTKKGKHFHQQLKDQGIPVFTWASGCVPFPTLAPEKSSKKRNKNMGAVWIPLHSNGFYLSAGDADEEDEFRIGKWASQLSQKKQGQRILKVSHHGSRYSSSKSFLQIIRPTVAWISVGASNSYGHPTLQTLTRLEKFKIPVFRTDRDGVLKSSTPPLIQSGLKQ